jgi:glycerol-1-phosphate dehydrogenase [NAD(P)+]
VLDPDSEPPSHGFKVAIGTLAATAMMEIVFSRPITDQDIQDAFVHWPPWNAVQDAIVRAFTGTPMLDRVIQEAQAKYIDAESLRDRLRHLQAQWDDLGVRVKQQLMPYLDLRAAFSRAGCPVAPETIGLTRDAAIDTAIPAQMIRNRYTILDLAFELNWMPFVLDTMKRSPQYLR